MKKRKIVATYVTMKLFSYFQSPTSQLITLVTNIRSENKYKKKTGRYLSTGAIPNKYDSHRKMVDKKGDTFEFLYFTSFTREVFNNLVEQY